MKHTLTALSIFVLIASCSKNGSTGSPTPPPSSTAPVVTTTQASSITSASAVAGGEVTSDGGAVVTSRGVCWSSSTNAPTPFVSGGYSSNGTGIGTFNSSITNLLPNTVYYYRAYAANSAGTGYGTTYTFNSLPIFSANIYIAGEVSNVPYVTAAIWKNGVPTILTSVANKGSARSVYVSGADVYVAGYESISGHDVAQLWKNGVATSLAPVNSNAQANAVFVDGADVYVAGYELVNGSRMARLWKNGVVSSLPSGTQGVANGLFVSGGNVYVAGYAKGVGSAGGNAVATVWVNGAPVYYTNGTYNYEARSVFVSGSDVYASGGGIPTNYAGLTWKNGVTIAGTSLVMNSVFILGTDVYIGGSFENAAQPFPAVYKNSYLTLQQNLSTGTVNSVYPFGTDVYAVGDEQGSNSIAFIPRLWKNGVGTTLPSPYNVGHAYSIFVTP